MTCHSNETGLYTWRMITRIIEDNMPEHFTLAQVILCSPISEWSNAYMNQLPFVDAVTLISNVFHEGGVTFLPTKKDIFREVYDYMMHWLSICIGEEQHEVEED